MTEAKCVHCGVDVEFVNGRWVDAGTADLVFCTDQDETYDGIRHEVVVRSLPLFKESS